MAYMCLKGYGECDAFGYCAETSDEDIEEIDEEDKKQCINRK